MAGDSKSHCGAHIELAKSEGVRITQCGCGAVHVHVLDNAVTLRLGAERFTQLADAMSAARRTIATKPNSGPPHSSGPTGSNGRDSIN
jgi:hypothetical protein